MDSATRRAVIASAAAGLFAPSRAQMSIDGDVVARARYGERDAAWEITLTDKYTATYTATLNRIPTGAIRGDFRFYDTEILEKERLPAFLQLPTTFIASEPSLHPCFYSIAIRNPQSGGFHEVSVLFSRNMPQSEGLKLFFEVWRNIWTGVPGYPRAPHSYAG